MTFAAPLLLAGLVLLVPVLLAFLVKRKRRTVRVPSTMLFRRIATSRAANRRIKHVSRLLALLACLLGVTFLAFAAARPSGPPEGDSVAIVVDVSASMQGEPMEEARAIAGRMLASRGARARYTIVAAGRTPRCLAPATDDAAALAHALAALDVERGEADLGAAMNLAAALVDGWRGGRVVLITDGGDGDAPPGRRARGVPIARYEVGEPRDNLGVSVFSAAVPRDANDAAERELLVGIVTSSRERRVADVVVDAGDAIIARRRVEVLPGEEAEIRVRVQVPGVRVRVRVEPGDGRDDAVAADDEASLTARQPLPARALLVSDVAEGLFFARAALEGAGVREVVEMTPDRARTEVRDEDVVVVIGQHAGRRIDAPTLHIGVEGRVGRLGETRELLASRGETAFRSIDVRHPLVRGVDLDGVAIERALAIDVPADGHGLVELEGGTVVAAGGAGRQSWAYVGVDPRRSDLVLRVAFPVLVANALSTLRGADGAVVADTVPRSEIEMRGATTETGVALSPPAFALPGSPPVWLALIGVLLLAGELFVFRRGWT